MRTRSTAWCLIAVMVAGTFTGCWSKRQFKLTAMPASPQNACEPAGIPFYLPKPLLVISKNFHHIEEPKVGLTNSAPIPTGYDDQRAYGDLKLDGTFTREGSSEVKDAPGVGTGALASPPQEHSPNGAPLSPGLYNTPTDGLAPHTFFTYEIVFVPDLTQKYVLSMEGGPGEMRAAMNLVNGWQYTGLGPYYMKDSSTAQNILAKGVAFNLTLGGAADVVNATAKLADQLKSTEPVNPRDLAELQRSMSRAAERETFDFTTVQGTIEDYAEIHVYEPFLDELGMMGWRQIVGAMDPATGTLNGHKFDRAYLGTVRRTADPNAGASFDRALERYLPPPVPSDNASRSSIGDTPRESAEKVRDNLNTLFQPAAAGEGGAAELLRPLPIAEPAKEKKGWLRLFHRKKPRNVNQSIELPSY